MNELADILLISGLVITTTVLWLHIRKGLGSASSKLLAVLFALIILLLLNYYAYQHEVRWLFYPTFIVEDSIIFLSGPILLGFVKSFRDSQRELPLRYWIHLAPSVIYVLLISCPVLYYFITKKFLFAYVEKLDDWAFLLPFQILYLIIYLLMGLRLWWQFDRQDDSDSSEESRYHRYWVRNLLIGLLLVCLIDGGTSIIETLFGDDKLSLELLTTTALVVLVAYLGYHGIARSGVLLPEIPHTARSHTSIAEKSSSLTEPSVPEPEYHEMAANLIKAMDEDQLYKNDSLSLRELAEAMNTTDKKLSQYLNQGLKRSFYDLLNEYRVLEVKRMIREGEHQHLSVHGMAMEAGFKSKTSFHRSFRKMTGMTPTQYRAQVQTA